VGGRERGKKGRKKRGRKEGNFRRQKDVKPAG
jgi:hypothetical protein